MPAHHQQLTHHLRGKYNELRKRPHQHQRSIESQVRNAAESTIQAYLAKHNVTRDQLRPEAITEAYAYARTQLEEKRDREGDAVYIALQAERERNRTMQLQLDALKQSRSNTNNNHQAPTGVDPNIVRAKMGERDWFALTDSQRLVACGVDPMKITAVDKENIRECFGGGNPHFASNLMKENPSEYRRLKNVSIVLPQLLKRRK